jgi:hypothetical protein
MVTEADPDVTVDESVPESFFGYLSPELPAAIGRIVMLSALLESKVAALASSVENREQAFYASNEVSENIRICERGLPLYSRTNDESRFAISAMAVVDEARSVLSARNAIVHRVRPRAGLAGWGGWKPLRRKERGTSVTWAEWTDDSPDDLSLLIGSLVDVIERYADIIATAGSFSSRPDVAARGAEK